MVSRIWLAVGGPYTFEGRRNLVLRSNLVDSNVHVSLFFFLNVLELYKYRFFTLTLYFFPISAIIWLHTSLYELLSLVKHY